MPESTPTVDGFTLTTEDRGATVQTDPATNVDFESAQLNGEVTDLDDESEVEAYFEYRETGAADWIETSKQTISTAQTYDETLTELDDDTEYEFRAVIDDTGGERLDTGDTLTFTTDVKQTGSVSTDPASNVSDDSAQLNGELTDLGDFDEADCFFRYRETGATSWNETTVQTLSSAQTFDETITSLTPETEYEFKAVASFDGEEELGDVLTFTTEEEEELDAEIVNQTSPLNGSEYSSQFIDFVFDVEFNVADDYFVEILVDDTVEFQDSVDNAEEEQVNNYNETIDTGDFSSFDWEIRVQLQSDGE